MFPWPFMFPPNPVNCLTGSKPPKVDVAKLRKTHQKTTQKFQQIRKDPNRPSIASTFDRTPCSSNKPLNSLSRVAIADLRVNIPAKGSYLLLRTIEQPCVLNAISTVVEDHNGDALLFCAYNLALEEEENIPQQVLPLGTIFILKEPYLKTTFSGDIILRTDSPSDVIILSKDHELFETSKNIKWKNEIAQEKSKELCSAGELKQQGNDFYLQKIYLSALRSYQSAVELLTPTEDDLRILLYLNISASCLILKCFESSQEYALKALAIDPKNQKGLYRAGRSHYELRQFELSKRYFEELISIQPDHREGKRELEKTRKRLKEISGTVNIQDLYHKSIVSPRTIIDHADYVGPLKVISSYMERRAVQATEDIKPGTLLAVSKALICVYTDFNPSCYINPSHPTTRGEFSKAVRETCQLIYKNPKTFGAVLYDLPINDAFLDAIVPKPFCDEACQETNVDVERIRKILTRNGIPVDNENGAGRPFGLVTGQTSSCALFSFPSHINHSCVPNASWITYNNIMVVNAIKHIKAGEEITISYFDPLISYSTKILECNKREFICNCRFCKSMRGIPNPLSQKIEYLLTAITELYSEFVLLKESACLGVLQRNVREITQLIDCTRPKELKYYLTVPYILLAEAFSAVGDYESSLPVVWLAIYALGFDSEVIVAWSNGQHDYPIAEGCLFSSNILNLINRLAICNSELGKREEAVKYQFAVEVGTAVYRGTRPVLT